VKILFWGLVAVGLLYGAYSGMIAVWSWIAVNNGVDEILSKDGVEALSSDEIKTKVLASASESGVPLTEKDVIVTREDRTVRVEVIWTVPVIIVRGDTVLAIPLSVKRTSSPKR
jgi:hypothetical protein